MEVTEDFCSAEAEGDQNDEKLPPDDAKVHREHESEGRSDRHAPEDFVTEHAERLDREGERWIDERSTHRDRGGEDDTTTTSEAMTKASVYCARGPLARVCEMTPRAADGLRAIARTPQKRATARAAAAGISRVKPMNGWAA